MIKENVQQSIYKGKEIFGNNVPLEKVELIFHIIEEGDIIELIDLDIQVWRIFNRLNIPELYDRMIVTSFFHRKATAILTNEQKLQKQHQ